MKYSKKNVVLILFALFLPLDGHGADLSFNGVNQLLVQCNLDGSPGQCEFDTGARVSTVNTDMVSQRWLAAHPVVGSTGLAGIGGIIQKYPVTVVNTIRIDDLTTQNVHFVLNRIDEQSNIGGNLIASMMSDTLGLYFDFGRMTLETVPQSQIKSLRPLTVINDTPLMPATVGDKSVSLVWDTGNANPTLISQKFIDENPKLFSSLNPELQVADSIGQDFGGGLYLCKELRIGGLTFNNIKVVATDLSFMNQRMGVSFQGVLGEDVIRQANWYLNYRTLKWAAKSRNLQ